MQWELSWKRFSLKQNPAGTVIDLIMEAPDIRMSTTCHVYAFFIKILHDLTKRFYGEEVFKWK